jgi:hypothetical protein
MCGVHSDLQQEYPPIYLRPPTKIPGGNRGSLARALGAITIARLA